MAEPNSYEEQRRRQVEETSGSWRSCACTASPSPSARPPSSRSRSVQAHASFLAKDQAAEAVSRRPDSAVRQGRRSARATRLPRQENQVHPCLTQTVLSIDFLCIGIGSTTYYSITWLSFRGGAYVQRRQLPPDDVYATDEASAYALTKAEELKSQLCSDHPSFVKPICYKTATASCLRIPQLFKGWYLPWCNEMIYLVDEQDVEFHLPYHALSGSIGTGWKMFAIGHNLADGDCLVFQQVQKTKFKVRLLKLF
ncbi:unnamed protein product [Triticum turgidum subsp. durum]|uniref:TF-B3 domain-containing protein n=1 Tax=Triticum turgidum subsp. durum TaxID=4567 RepID=A0A9R1NMQ8_TRITD|nr:unnamed protein product [Triticum turgidum subsp. durum]